MKFQIRCVPMLVFVLASAALAQDQKKDQAKHVERTPVKSMEELDWLVGTGEGIETLHDDMPGIGKKGDELKQRVTTKKTLDGKFLMTTGWIIKGNETHEMFHEIWGTEPSSPQIHKWYFDRSGASLQGKVYWEGDERLVHVVEGMLTPNDEPFKQLAEKMKVTELRYYGEIVFRRVDEKTMGVTVQSVKIEGIPIPWPNLNKESLYRAVE